MGNNFFKGSAALITVIKNVIVIKAITAEWIRSMLMPALRSKPITLKGIPNFIKLFDIFSEVDGLIFPTK